MFTIFFEVIRKMVGFKASDRNMLDWQNYYAWVEAYMSGADDAV